MPARPRSPRVAAAVGVGLSLLLVLGSLAVMGVVLGRSAAVTSAVTSAVPSSVTSADPQASRPNVVVVVADDLDWSLVPHMPHVRELVGDQGAVLERYYVEQGTCCTSRATMLSGQYVHNHGVEANAWPRGGFERWHDGREATALPTWLQAAGYRTSLLGKYLNEYPAPSSFPADVRAERAGLVPPGWDRWMVPVQGNAYAQDHYRLNVDGVVDPEHREDYLDDVLGRRLVDTVGEGPDGLDLAQGGAFVWYASYSPHTPYAHPARYDDVATGLRYPRGPAYDEADVGDKFGMTRTRPRLSPAYQAEIDRAFRERVRSVQALDANVAALVAALERQGALEDTYVVFTSDNGYQMGEHRREIGKYNQFEQAVRVPLMIRGPGIEPGTRIDEVVGNVDLAPTIAAITGARAPYEPDGVDLLPLLTGEVDTLGRDGLLLGRALLPQYRTAPSPLDEAPEDFVADGRVSRLNDFTGVVTRGWKLVRYTHLPHEELYHLREDPDELDNLLRDGQASYDAMPPATQAVLDRLRARLDDLEGCAGAVCTAPGPEVSAPPGAPAGAR